MSVCLVLDEKLKMAVTDSGGSWGSHEDHRPPVGEVAEHGRGLAIIRALSESITFHYSSHHATVRVALRTAPAWEMPARGGTRDHPIRSFPIGAAPVAVAAGVA